MLLRPSNPILQNQKNLFPWLTLDWWGPLASWLIRSLDPLQHEREIILFFFANSCLKIHDPALKFRLVRVFLQMHLRGEITRNCHDLSTSPNTHGVVSHRHKTYLSSRLFLSLLILKSKVKVLTAMVLRYHCSQFLLFSESPLMSPNFLSHCVIHQDLVEHVDNHNFPGIFIFSRVFRGIPTSRLGFLSSR